MRVTKLKYLLLFIFIFLFYGVKGQKNDISVSPLWSLNTPADEIFCTFIDDQIVISSNVYNVIVGDIHRDKNQFSLFQGMEVGNFEFELKGEFLDKRVFEDVGSAYFDEENQTLWFSTVYNFNNDQGNTIKIYTIKKTKRGWKRPRSFKFNSEFHSTAHPWINKDGTQLFFSSDMEGGAGKMDIWFCNKLENDKWSEPIWGGDAINSPANEIFPTWHDGDIYFSSDIHPENGLDIYRALHVMQWEKTEKLRQPFNSEGDDLQLVFRDDESGFLTSRRTYGAGGDDIYFFRIKKKSTEADELSFLLQFKDTPLQDIQLLLTDEDDILLGDITTNTEGLSSLSGVDLTKMQKIYVLDVDDKFLEECILYLVDKDGKKIRSFRFGKDGFFKFEYLPLDMLGELPRLDETDHSLLSLNLKGQIYQEEPGDIGKNQTVYVTDSKGNLLALGYTSKDGKFDIDEVSPQKNYLFKFDSESEVKKLQIEDVDGEKTITVNRGLAAYHRLDGEEGIRIIDENKKPIFISENESFIIKNIYYQFDSIALNEIAQTQLGDLAMIMRNNPRIKIELGSHTDSRGTASYNLILSNDRAEKAVQFLNSLGIVKSRMQAVGHGEYELQNECTDEEECSDEEHALNRRTEIKIFID